MREEAEHKFIDESHTVSHAVVLDKLDVEPVCNVYGFA